MIEIECRGAARGVTGSMHLVRVGGRQVLLECGMFQGRRRESLERNRRLRVKPHEIDAVVLSHAHIDHSGSLPMLYKHGYRGPIYATPATRDLCAVMLEDSANIQAHDAEWINDRIARGQSDMTPVEPLYTIEDVTGTLSLVRGLPYHQRATVTEGVDLTFFDAGHVLGSALVALDLDDVGDIRRFLFTGDLGRRDMPILRDPELPDGVDVLMMEGTYGDRKHDPIEKMEGELEAVIRKTVELGGKVLIPSFALERAQEVVYALARLQQQGRLPDVPVYVDSPLTVKITDVFRMHPECYDRELRDLLMSGASPFDFAGLRYIASVEGSKAISGSRAPAIVIAASGMCEFGRVTHHLRAVVEDPNSVVVIVGFQAQHTLGRRLVEGRRQVRVLGVERERRVRVKVLDGFSAHADQTDLLAFAEAMRERGPLRHVALVHGEPTSLDVLEKLLEDQGFPSVTVPKEGVPFQV